MHDVGFLRSDQNIRPHLKVFSNGIQTRTVPCLCVQKQPL